jgi:hypothetical protein
MMADGARESRREQAVLGDAPAERRLVGTPEGGRSTHEIVEELRPRVRRVIERYAEELSARGGLAAAGGADQVAATIAAVLPHPNRLSERVGPVYTTGQLQRLLPGRDAEPISDQAVRNRLEAGRLIAGKTRVGRWAYPSFQFLPRPGRLAVREDVLEVWRMLPWDGPIDAWTLVSWMTGPRADLDGRSPLRWLDEHGVDERLVRAVGQVRRRATA